MRAETRWRSKEKRKQERDGELGERLLIYMVLAGMTLSATRVGRVWVGQGWGNDMGGFPSTPKQMP